jgi:integrase
MLNGHVLPVFRKVLVTEINRLMVKKFFMGKINDGLAASTVTHMKNTMGGTLNLAVDDEVIPVNPAHRLGRVFKTKGLKIESDPLNREELSLLLESFREHFPFHYPVALTLARTGMRVGEAMALQWGDIDFHGRFIHILRGFSRGRIETPKSGKARKVDMSLQLTETLTKLRHQRKIEAVKKGWGKVPEWVFLNQEGTPLDSSHWRSRVFNKALEKAGLRKIRIHDLRHTYGAPGDRQKVVDESSIR